MVNSAQFCEKNECCVMVDLATVAFRIAGARARPTRDIPSNAGPALFLCNCNRAEFRPIKNVKNAGPACLPRTILVVAHCKK
jgi:hypothetical protein